MVYLEFVEERNNDIVFDYMPEHETADRGRVAVNRNTGERKLLKKSLDDEGFNYRSHAWRRIEQMIADGEIKQQAFSAWY